ncbi:MAG: DoxX family protein [Oligoflexia bacterium]|nr:DoxX family protein [Oligoflexia bacterium]
MDKSSLLSFGRQVYGWFVALGTCLVQPVLLLLFRLQWGWQFYLSGKGKLLNHATTTEFFTGLGIPMPELNAWFVGGVECVGGLLLLVGLCSRPVGAILSVNMIVAYLSVDSDREKFFAIFSDPSGFIGADPFFFLVLALLMLAFGAGAISLDALLQRTAFRK